MKNRNTLAVWDITEIIRPVQTNPNWTLKLTKFVNLRQNVANTLTNFDRDLAQFDNKKNNIGKKRQTASENKQNNIEQREKTQTESSIRTKSEKVTKQRTAFEKHLKHIEKTKDANETLPVKRMNI